MDKIFETPADGQYFFGYYDKSPFCIENTKLLACRANFVDRNPTKNDELEIGYFDWKKSDIFEVVTSTKAWNWQQGCMLQWFGDCKTQIVFNDLRKGRFVTIVFDLLTKEELIFDMAYYALSGNFDFLLCIDNERHYWLREGYNYQGLEKIEKKGQDVVNDGIWRVDLLSKKTTQIISIDALKLVSPLSNMKNATHFVEHLMVSPNGNRFTFLHRWKMEEGGVYARLFTANTDGTDIHLVSDSGRMSHFSWRTNSEIIAWGGLNNPINSLKKYKSLIKFLVKPLMPLYRKLIGGNSVDGNSKLSSFITGDSYILFKDLCATSDRLFLNILNKDGHPTISPTNKNLMLTDTYPDINNQYKQTLMLANIENNTFTVVDELEHLENCFGTTFRCDLHPKWSKDGNYFSVDTMANGYRSIFVYGRI